MTNDNFYYMCNLRRGTINTTAWIAANGARVGAVVALEDGDLWTVVHVGDKPRPKAEIDARNAFGSLA